MSLKIGDTEKTEEMKNYEEETGKNAIWRGELTERFKKWLKGDKIYSQKKDKEKVVSYLESEVKEKWIDFAKTNDYGSISKLARSGVNFLTEITNLSRNLGFKTNYDNVLNMVKESINSYYKKEKYTDSEIFHDLKEPLTIIRGFVNLAIKDFPKHETQRYLEEIQNSCIVLEEKIKLFFETKSIKLHKYDVLLIEDDLGTSKLVIEHFNRKKITIKSVQYAKDALKELSVNIPKLILLDIFLPDMTGDVFYSKLKSNRNYNQIPVVYLTAIPKKEAEEKIKGSEANGLILKPFDFDDFQFVSKFLT